jgi:hypothetical protein
MVTGLRSIAKAMESPPEPTVRAPALDPTERRTVASIGATRCATSDPTPLMDVQQNASGGKGPDR